MSLRRITKELADIARTADKYQHMFTAGPVGDDMFQWKGTVFGPKDTPYEGGVFVLNIVFPADYPLRPPRVTFETKVYHPSVQDTGVFCLSMLSLDWSPALNIIEVLTAVYSMLVDPDAETALNPPIGIQLRQDPAGFAKTARDWTLQYASQ